MAQNTMAFTPSEAVALLGVDLGAIIRKQALAAFR
jgi:hypothetical protein